MSNSMLAIFGLTAALAFIWYAILSSYRIYQDSLFERVMIAAFKHRQHVVFVNEVFLGRLRKAAKSEIVLPDEFRLTDSEGRLHVFKKLSEGSCLPQWAYLGIMKYEK